MTNTILELTGLNLIMFIVLVLWILVWKGWALWIAARKGSKAWYIALLVLNTVGILEIIYIFYYSKRDTFNKDSIDEKVSVN